MPANPETALRSSRLSRAEALAREVEEDISVGVLTTGDRLGTKNDLRRRFNVAPATVNEAIKLLDNRGLVEARPGPGGGVFVADPASRMRRGPMVMGFTWTEATIDDYHEVRSALEPLIVRHAGRRRTAADIRSLEMILANMAASLDKPLAYARYNTAFHRRIAKLTANAPLRSLYVTLLDFFENDLTQGMLPPTVDPGNLAVHRQLLDAIKEGEGPGLEAAMASHDHLRTSLGMFQPSDPAALADAVG